MEDARDGTQALQARLARAEERIATLEHVLGVSGDTTPATTATRPAVSGAPVAASASPAAPGEVYSNPLVEADTRKAAGLPSGDSLGTRTDADDGRTASRLMAWGAAFAFLLATVYLLRLVYDSGWLTPPRQLTLAALGGCALIVAGVLVARLDRAYAAYLPAAGTAVLYLTAYAAHLYYELISRHAAIAAVAAISLAALWLGRLFNHSVFAALATVGTYAFPLALTGSGVAIADLVVWYAAWSVAFSLASLVEGRRTAYVLSMFFSLIAFQWAWQTGGQPGDWVGVAIFQCFLFVLSCLTAVAFSVTHHRPMDTPTAVVHGIALFYFYLLEYTLLNRHAPALAGLIALGSAVFVLAAYLVSRRFLPASRRTAGAYLASTYCAVVTAHVLVFDWLPDGLLPWAALFAPLAMPAFAPLFRDTPQAMAPIRAVSLVVFAIGLAITVVGEPSAATPLPGALLLAYAGALYGGYVLTREDRTASTALLYAGHVAVMLASARILDSGLGLSLAWACLALTVLLLALARRDRDLGRSSLLVFGVSAGKVLLLDLDGSDSVLRVLSLVVVGISLYAGGWLYQRMFRQPDDHPPSRTESTAPETTP